VPERVDPEYAADERTTLVQFLDYYRESLHLKAAGLSDAQAATASCPPSILTITGLIRHMTEVERNWFRRCFRGEAVPPLYYDEEHLDADLDEVRPDTSLAAAVRAWRDEIAVADGIVASVGDPGELSTGTRHGQRPSLRWILVHMIEEYARHCGHADLLRERIDGVVGD